MSMYLADAIQLDCLLTNIGVTIATVAVFPYADDETVAVMSFALIFGWGAYIALSVRYVKARWSMYRLDRVSTPRR